MIGGVTRHILPHLLGVPHLHVNRPESAPCSMQAMVCCRYVIEQTEITTHLDKINQKYV